LRGDIGEMQGRHRGDIGEIKGRYRGDIGACSASDAAGVVPLS
jgi:hypothetical protein